MLKILFVNHVSLVSGAEKVLLTLVTSLDRDAVTAVVICPENGPLVKKLTSRDIIVRLIPMSSLVRTCNPLKLLKYLWCSIRFCKLLRHQVKELDIDIIHCNSFTAVLYSLLPAKLSKTPIIWHMHDILQARLSNKIFIRLAAHWTDKIICVSHATKKRLLEFGVDEKKCEVIYNSADQLSSQQQKTQGEFRKEFGIGDNARVVTMIGQIAQWKGQHVFIEAVSKLADRYTHIKYVIAGDILNQTEQLYKQHIHQMTDSLNLNDRIIFTGFRDDVQKIINDSDIIVHASVKPDPLPTVIIEAMSANKPAVATNVGGVPELVVDNETGFLVPPADSEQLAQAISKLLDDPEMANKFGINAETVIKKRFNIKDNLAKLLKVYNSFSREGRKAT